MRVDFIERIFGVSPDGGSGLLEVALFLVPLLVLAAGAIRRHKRRRSRG